jgi:hypothetical protein
MLQNRRAAAQSQTAGSGSLHASSRAPTTLLLAALVLGLLLAGSGPANAGPTSAVTSQWVAPGQTGTAAVAPAAATPGYDPALRRYPT